MGLLVIYLQNQDLFSIQENPTNDYYMVMDGVDDMLEVYHTDNLLLGDNNGDYTISLAFLQTVETAEHEHSARCIIHKGRWRQYRTANIWKNLDNTGFCPSLNSLPWYDFK